MARHLQSFARIGLAAGCVLAPSLASAQRDRVPDPNATRVLVGVFRTPAAEKNLGVQAADAIRSRMRTDFPYKQVYVLPKEEANVHLEASGFPTTEPLASHDIRALAQQVRADEYIQGTATKTATGFRLEPMMVLSRDNSLVQPLGVHEGPNLTAAATSASKELKEARKQIDAEKACIAAAREKKFDEAKAAAKAGIAAYPKATLARICLANVMVTDSSPAEELLAVSKEIVSIDPRSKPGHKFAAQAYQNLKMSDSVVVTLTRLLQIDPTSPEVPAYIEIIATEANPGVARPIIEAAIAENPGDPDLQRLYWRILIAMRDYKGAFAAGEALIALDTANADAAYFLTTSNAYVRDSQPQKAAEVASRGVAKFPENGDLIYMQVNALRAAGQAQQALEALDRALQAKIAIDGGVALRLQLLRDLNRTDEILPAAKAMIAAGDTTADLRAVMINAANDQLKKVGQSTNPTDWEPVIAAAMYADSVALPSQKVQSQFILGVVNTLYGRATLNVANEKRDCALAKKAKDMFVEAQILLPKGGAFAPNEMRQYMGVVMQLDAAADQVIGGLKCG